MEQQNEDFYFWMSWREIPSPPNRKIFELLQLVPRHNHEASVAVMIWKCTRMSRNGVGRLPCFSRELEREKI